MKIGVIGGSGLYNIEGLKEVKEIRLETPFGEPSDAYIYGKLGDKEVYFLPRHGRGHVYLPSEVPYRANIYGFKMLGVDCIISVSAVGSMREEIKPGDFVIVTQYFDRTKNRPSTFFGNGIVAHIPFDTPTCPYLNKVVHEACIAEGIPVHREGTYICIEGPQFSTKAESKIYRSWGVDVIGMTNIPEAKLAREAEIPYSAVALATDYDVWKEGEEVNVEKVLQTMARNIENAKKMLKRVIETIKPEDIENSPAKTALVGAIQTKPEFISEEVKKRLWLLLKDRI
ncbi:methylthioadenosine phosphorylase [Thermovibrio guaymasensis]|uniref:S-methyl-5'-thioadenosine phosphorylase n=1 Tax=Thermovibrio guaymasensis TaxID=240167 RepID=A0A420W7K6_9BACT|nr:S-methyl-5'-thioadenosine phosphorylase [Thermovibrio guaymasensis]RKQ63283.1 methylthioadenosine phosphorylase [Thermovibrio guaymasensis]